MLRLHESAHASAFFVVRNVGVMSRISQRSVPRIVRARALPGGDISQRPRTLLFGFIALHVLFLFALLPSIIAGDALGDLQLYRVWAMDGFRTGLWHGIQLPWVYPIGAMVPIAGAALAGSAHFLALWLLFTMALNALAIGVLTDFGRKQSSYPAAWWMLLVWFILSPVGLLRLEGLVAPLVVIALVILARRPFAAGVILAIVTWIKVWPVAVILAILSVARRRALVLGAGMLVSSCVVAVVTLLGGLSNVTSFVTAQSDRNLQLESPVATPWVWAAAFDVPGSYIYQNVELATREVAGTGATAMAAVMTPLMLLAVAVIVVLLVIAQRRTMVPVATRFAPETDASVSLILQGALAITLALVVFNKVGSPQYMLWIAPVVVAGLAHNAQAWRVPSQFMLAISVLTTLIFPLFYMSLANADIGAVMLLTARNILVVVLFCWSMWRLVLLAFKPDAATATSLQTVRFSSVSVRRPAQSDAAAIASEDSVSGDK